MLTTKSITGIDSSGAHIHTGEMITNAVAFAAAHGASIQMGACPTGMYLPPRVLTDQPCSAVILSALSKHPDWMTSMDYSTEPPTLNVTDRTATPATLAVTAASDLDITRRDDLKVTQVTIYLESQSGWILDRYDSTGGWPCKSDGKLAGSGLMYRVVEIHCPA